MKELLKYNNRRIEITAYSGAIERNLVLYNYSRTEESPAKLEDLLFILKDNIKSNIPLNKLEREEIVYILYALRGISVSDSIPLNFDCPLCKNKFNLELGVNSILEAHDFKCTIIDNIYSQKAEDYIPFWVSSRIEDNIPLYDRLISYIENHKTKFNLIREVNCISCNSPYTLDLGDLSLLCKSFSSFDVLGFYNSINSLIYYGKCSADDLYNHLLPFERELLTSYIQTEIEKAQTQSKQTLT